MENINITVSKVPSSGNKRVFNKSYGYLKKANIDNNDLDNKILNNVSDIPIENLSISILGTINAGKSTLLNSLFCNSMSHTSIKRSTMSCYCFVENKNIINSIELSTKIFQEIETNNSAIIELTEESYCEDMICQQKVFNVGSLDVNFIPNSNINIYDVPGINDSKTKSVFFKYLNDYFFQFNIVIFMIDIYLGMNTSDEMDILQLIIRKTKEMKEKYNKNIYTLCVANKCDDLQIIDDKLCLNNELNEMFNQINKTVYAEFNKENLGDNVIGINKLCAIDSYLYRMISRYGNRFELSDSDITKLGSQDMGKKFVRLSKADQLIEVQKIINDCQFITDMVKLSGFEQFEKTLHNFLQDDNRGNKLRIENILFHMSFLLNIEDIIIQSNNTANIQMIKANIVKYMKYMNMIKSIDEDFYNDKMKNFVKKVEDGYKAIIISLSNFNEIKNYYDNVNNNINKIFFKNFIDSDYPIYMRDSIFDNILDKCKAKCLSLQEFIDILSLIDKINYFDNEHLIQLYDTMIKNINNKAMITFSNIIIEQFHSIILKLIPFSPKMMSIDFQFLSSFMRFLLINIYSSKVYTKTELKLKQLYFQQSSEMMMNSYLTNCLFGMNIDWSFYVHNLIRNDEVDCDFYLLEKFYIQFENAYNQVNIQKSF